MGVIYKNEAEKTDLQADTPSSINSIHDLRELYYQGKLGLSGTAARQETELVRSFLQSQTGLTTNFSLHDLWVAYLVDVKGIARRSSVPDMLKEFFTGPIAGNPSSSNNAGLVMGLPFGLTYAS